MPSLCAKLPVDWIFPTPSVEKRTMYHWTGDILEERHYACKGMREVQGGRIRRNAQMYKQLTQNIRAICLVWYFDPRIPRIIHGTIYKLRLFWAGPYCFMKLITPALAVIKPVYFPGEERLVSLDVLKLYRGEDVICQNSEDIDQDQWLDEVELMELLKVYRMEAEER